MEPTVQFAFILYVHDLFHILLSLCQTYGSMECVYGCMSVTLCACLNAVTKIKPEFECRPVTSTEFINSGLVSNSTVQYHD
jgi:hypothetical protein